MKSYEPHQQRVINEADELEQRLIKLKMFIENVSFNAINERQKGLLIRQAAMMNGYLDILKQRIEDWIANE
jgi:hypothetical protein